MIHLTPALPGLRSLPCLLTLAAACMLVLPARGQDHHHHRHPHTGWGNASHVVVPQRAAFDLGSFGEAILIDSVKAEVRILEQTASTTLEIALRNPSSRQAEAIILLPVPDGAAVSAFMFDGPAAEATAQVLRQEEARRLYDAIVAKVRDPALLEFAGYNLIRSSVFPVPPQGAQKVRLTYEHLLNADGDRIDYALPRSESLQQEAPWDIRVDIQSREPVSTVYSPSHQIAPRRLSDRHVTMSLTEHAKTQPGPFLLSWLRQTDGVSASLFAYPDPAIGGGYFLLMAGLPVSISDSGAHVPREVTLVLDRSGSMAGEKVDQVQAAAMQIIDGLAPDESFNIIDYSTTVSMFSAQPLLRSPQARLDARHYLQALRPSGGTNIHDALLEALRQKPTPGMLPIVLFLTDGLPTVGKTAESQIRTMVEAANVHQRRIFAFGVGGDVNVPLLDRIADETRASAAYVLPGEDVELKVAQVFKRLYGPVLSDLDLRTLDAAGAVSTRRIREMVPVKLPDLFEDDQLIVMGQYVGDAPLKFQLRGSFMGRPRSFAFEFDLDSATTRNAFVPRLWATRRIAYLVDQIRQAGGGSVNTLPVAGTSIFDDPRFAELANEILRLSTEFGVLTEYTAFLATEGADLSNWTELTARCTTTLDNRAVKTRSGVAALNQGLNFNEQKQVGCRDFRNAYVDEKLNRVEVTGVQQICDRTFFKRGNRWIDGRLVADQAGIQPDEVLEFGSPKHRALLRRLVGEHRQGVLSLEGELLIRLEGRNVLVRNGGGQ